MITNHLLFLCKLIQVEIAHNPLYVGLRQARAICSFLICITGVWSAFPQLEVLHHRKRNRLRLPCKLQQALRMVSSAMGGCIRLENKQVIMITRAHKHDDQPIKLLAARRRAKCITNPPSSINKREALKVPVLPDSAIILMASLFH